jgi:DNA (cytosine-5)-methyltransferase 1
MTFGSLFAGIGGFDLGFERAGLVCKWQVEIDPFCRKVLAKHWPDVPKHDDVRTFPDGDPKDWQVDVICGGFPCQDISFAGAGAGIAKGTRSGLWYEYPRIIRDLRPRFVVVENVPALLVRGLGRVLGDLAECGLHAEWSCLSAEEIGAAQPRDRVWVVAYGAGEHGVANGPIFRRQKPTRMGTWWESEPGVVRVADGVPNRMDRLRGLGNAVVPQVAEWIGRQLINAGNSG